MKLIDWIKAEGRTMTSVAMEWGISPATLSRVCSGSRWPSDLIIVRSHEVSNGQIGVPDWIETCRTALEADGVLQPTNGA